jgi:hypothetical protein
VVLGLLLLCGGAGFFLWQREAAARAEAEVQARDKAAETEQARQELRQAQAQLRALALEAQRTGAGRGPRGVVPGPVQFPAPGPADLPARRVTLDLPPVPAPLPIRPGAVKSPTAVDLPERVHGVTVGGGGRFLLLHFQSLRKLGVFDANEAKVVDYVPLDEDNVSVAAGMNKFVVFQPGQGAVRRYDLLTRRREADAKLELGGRLLSFCMGAGSDGPVLVSGERTFHLLDLETLRPLELPPAENARGQGLAGYSYWSGGPGRLFGATRAGGGSPSGVATLVLRRDGLRLNYEHESSWFVVPGPDGKNVFVGGHGLKLADLSPSPDGEGFPNSRGNVETTYLPAHHGPFFMRLHVFSLPGRPRDGAPERGVTVYLLGSHKPLAQLADVGVVGYDEFRALAGLGYPGSVHLLPWADLLVVVPASRDKLLLHPVDLNAALARSGVPYLFVTSAPPARFRPGEKLEYQVEARSQAGGVTYHLEAGPPGMAVTPAGRLEWTPPADFAGQEVSVVVNVRAGDGRQTLHSFVLANANRT